MRRLCASLACRCKCGHQWCYMCKGDWSKHGSHTGGHYKCNIYEEQKAIKTKNVGACVCAGGYAAVARAA